MKGIIRFSLNNKFALWIMTIIVVVSGLYAGMNMKQETLPNLEIPILQMTTIYPAAAPEEVVEKVTKPLEQRVKNLKGVKSVTSTSMENVSSIIVEYDYKQDMDKAASDAREAVTSVTFPTGVQKPTVSRISLNAFPVISLSVADDKHSLEELTKLIETRIKPDMEGLEGVDNVSIAGQYLREVQLTFKKDKMKELGLSEDTVKGIVQGSALKVPLGLFELEKSSKTVVVDGNIVSLEDLQNIEIPVIPSSAGQGQGQGLGSAGGQMPQGMPTGQPAGAPSGMVAIPGIPTVHLKDIADLQMIGKAESISRTNGKESVSISVVKGADANTVDVVNKVKDQIKTIEKENPGMHVTVMMDQGKPIEDSVNTMFSKAIFGALFAVVVILLFLRNIRTTIISIVSIPLSLLIGVLVLKQMDITLNMMSLGAMTVAIGRVVDDSIVVIENIYRRMSLKNEKLKGKELILEATKEMFTPIMSSTIVTLAVFLPLGLVSGMVGELFMPFALTMVFALLASLVVAITIVPMLAHMMFRKGIKNPHTHEEKPGKLASGYKKILNWTLNHKLITFGAAVLLLVGSMFLVKVIGVSFLPQEEDKYAMVTYSPAPGELLDDVKATTSDAEKFVLDRTGIQNMQYSVGGSNPMMPGSSKSALFYVQYENSFKGFDNEKKELVKGLNDLSSTHGEWKLMDMGGGIGGSGLTLTVFGDSLEEIEPVVQQIQELMKTNTNFENVTTSLSETYGQYTLVADQAKLSKLGLTAGQIAMKLSPVRERPVLTKVHVDGKEYDVYINVDKQEYNSIQDIENTTIQSPLGMEVALKDVVQVREGKSPNTITRKDDRMNANIKADITISDISKASSDLEKQINELTLPPTVDVKFGGVTEQINDTFTQLGLAMAAAIAIVYLVLVITFHGALAPFAILFSLPFTIIGALVALYFAGETLSVSALMGALMLIGIVVTNAIVLLDRVIHKEKEGLSTREALLEAGGTRLRPILMTALATIGALLPLALGFEGAGIISRGLGVTVIGGLTSSTLLTLVIVPIVYEFLMKFRKKNRDADI
ncbi:efflux RND transporter permease subunit [Paenibacillus albiflavus]|uniref:Efflux RND transporter permease subunit n=1 Tax=Paenibacillus albiflavus TaxID=2545760 RepID=A0A4R4EQY0_9BACL|nr:efflux RND transporter permease subunit [Paenibacillus albiflavus]TCZ80925.1 efflux RND transporter permease subunit [Paenibacillus albiflavus]